MACVLNLPLRQNIVDSLAGFSGDEYSLFDGLAGDPDQRIIALGLSPPVRVLSPRARIVEYIWVAHCEKRRASLPPGAGVVASVWRVQACSQAMRVTSAASAGSGLHLLGIFVRSGVLAQNLLMIQSDDQIGLIAIRSSI